METIAIYLVVAFIGAGIGAGIGVFAYRKIREKIPMVPQQELSEAQTQLRVAEERAKSNENNLNELKAQFQATQGEYSSLRERYASLETQNKNLNTKLEEQLVQFEKDQKEIQTRFENLANKILNEQSERFSEQSVTKLNQLVNPMKEQLTKFSQQVDTVHKENIRDSTTLKNKLDELTTTNSALNEQAKDLTEALKGDNKSQGNWGELVLERVLEASGLTEDREFIRQAKGMDLVDEDGKKQIPDILIKLPDEKHLVVDSKVSLTAYTRYVNADTRYCRKLWI